MLGAAGMILLTVFSSLAASYGMNLWNRASLRRAGAARCHHRSFLVDHLFSALVASVCFVVMQVYGRMTMQRRWRAC